MFKIVQKEGDLLTVFLKHIHIVIAVSFRPAIYFGMSAKKLTFLNCTELFICEKKMPKFFLTLISTRIYYFLLMTFLHVELA